MDFREMRTSLWLFSLLAVAERDDDERGKLEALARAKLELLRHPEFMTQSELGVYATSMVMDAFSRPRQTAHTPSK
ncbi:hypothetical protein EDD52_1702 [Primorskyibacter sedentarius]|uniref:Uncharacterized protein n=1 Tax=Primorskyibacter sedentarius TaxID=745311 RepID=A0A4R3IFE9_9RHOB|nr:hypothetical protein EDD52_1702 [Primorskyibacter sedentarius]